MLAIGGGAVGVSGAMGLSSPTKGTGIKLLKELVKAMREDTSASKVNSKKQIDEFADLMKRTNIITGAPDPITGLPRLPSLRSLGASGADKTESLSDDELFKLISVAADKGVDINGLIGNKRLEGGVPPVIAIRIFKNTITQNIEAPVTVNGAEGETVERLADVVVDRVRAVYSDEVTEALREMTPAFVK